MRANTERKQSQPTGNGESSSFVDKQNDFINLYQPKLHT